jgi:hypothetical protein
MALRIDRPKNNPNDIVVRFPARSWELAHGIVEGLRESPPQGYRLQRAGVVQKSKSGRRCNVKMDFVYIDTREPVFTIQEAAVWFAPFAETASDLG